MKPKAQTMAQRFGFADPDLTTPKHDAIMMWLDGVMPDIANLTNPGWHIMTQVNYLNPRLNYSPTMPESIQKEAEKRAEKMLAQILVELSLPEKPVPVVRKTWELPIVDRTYTIGFCDMYAQWQFPRITCLFNVTCLAERGHEYDNNREHTWEYAGSAMHKPTHFYADHQAYFEVKPSIPSLGEVIRQVRMYQTYTRGQTTAWWIVSPDTRFKDQIEAQGIKFLAVPASI